MAEGCEHRNWRIVCKGTIGVLVQCGACGLEQVLPFPPASSTREEIREVVQGQTDSLRTFLAAATVAPDRFAGARETALAIRADREAKEERHAIAHRLLADRQNLLRAWTGRAAHRRELEPYEAEILKTMQRAAELLDPSLEKLRTP